MELDNVEAIEELAGAGPGLAILPRLVVTGSGERAGVGRGATATEGGK